MATDGDRPEVGLRDYVAASALVTDLVVTAAGHTATDRLTSPDQLAAFLDAHGVAHGRIDGTDLDEARELRTELRAVFGHPTDAKVVAAASALLQRCPHRLTAGAGHATAPHGDWRVVPTPDASTVDHVRLIAGAGLLAVVHALGADRLRGCASPRCAGVFVDTSSTGRRRYCIPRICGNRLNVARYRERRSAEPDHR